MSNVIMSCPICESNIREITSGSWGTTEEIHQSCHICKLYHYEFSYGAERWTVDEEEYFDYNVKLTTAIAAAKISFHKANPNFVRKVFDSLGLM